MVTQTLAWAEISYVTYIAIHKLPTPAGAIPVFSVKIDLGNSGTIPRISHITTSSQYGTINAAVKEYVRLIDTLTGNAPENVTNFYADAEVNRRLISTAPQDSAYLNAYIREARRHKSWD
jgi:hypothetical protein